MLPVLQLCAHVLTMTLHAEWEHAQVRYREDRAVAM